MVGYAREPIRSAGECPLPVASYHPAEDVAELRVVSATDGRGVTRLDLGDDLVAEPQLLEPALGGDDELGATVLRVGAALDVAELLELVDETPDDLLVTAREAGELRRPTPSSSR